LSGLDCIGFISGDRWCSNWDNAELNEAALAALLNYSADQLWLLDGLFDGLDYALGAAFVGSTGIALNENAHLVPLGQPLDNVLEP